jgi:hypothetical protein
VTVTADHGHGKYHEHPPSVGAQSFKTTGPPGSGRLTFLCAALTGVLVGCLARGIHLAYLAMGRRVIKCRPPSKRAQSHLQPYISLSTCRWRSALNVSTAHG